jgi:hypothetical protein
MAVESVGPTEGQSADRRCANSFHPERCHVALHYRNSDSVV